ncbi:MAG: c-type cytochrome [Bacteroidota bacterium]
MAKGRLSIGVWILCCFLASCSQESQQVLTAHIEVPDGFVVEQLYNPSDSTLNQGSWVSMCLDDKGRIIASDQYGALYRLTPPPIGENPSKTLVEEIPIEVGYAQGLLWAFNSLYISVNAFPNSGADKKGSGFYRAEDTDGDDMLDKVERIVDLDGSGEHGPHAILLGPDEQSLYVLGGNHTDPPKEFTSILPMNWGNDNLLPVIKDPRGHANHRKAPGGWVAKVDPSGKNWEIVSSGFRNSYDMAFTDDGELLVFDSDMEWDMGMPWYRPIRVLHAIPGSEFGWRTGTGKWPAYYPDNLPEVLNIGQGSPTGVIMGKGLAFPQRFQEGMFINDWSFGTMYFVALEQKGSSFVGTKEEFLSGVPLPLTDVIVGSDGAMYFATGGRRVSSHLYRVYYKGEADTSPVPGVSLAVNDAVSARRNLESAIQSLQVELNTEEKVEKPGEYESLFWDHLAHGDRHVRYLARIGLEKLGEKRWMDRYLLEKDPIEAIHASLALARSDAPLSKGISLSKLAKIDFEGLSEGQQLDLLRTYGVIFTRYGFPNKRTWRNIVDQLNPYFPSNSLALNQELCQVLSYLEAPGIVGRTLSLLEGAENAQSTPILTETVSLRSEQYGPTIREMLENMPPSEEISYVKSLSHVDKGWTFEQRKQYFQWFSDALSKSGGESYKGFIDRIRTQALEHVPDREKALLADENDQFIAFKAVDFAALPKPKGPGSNYSMNELRTILREERENPRNYDYGKQMYEASMCASCHAMKGQGGNIGPDLTQAHTRFKENEILYAIMAPSDAISDQYISTQLELNDGEVLNGRILSEEEGVLKVNTNPYDATQFVEVEATQVKERNPSPVSTMPPGLLNRLNSEEIADLMAYIMSGADPENEIYQ